ncbi:MAG: hypothetical protein AB7F64_00080 [Gammaproteobacteria bacterium]
MKTSQKQASSYSIIGMLVGFFSLNSRFIAAQTALQNSEAKRQECISLADKTIAESQWRIQDSDALIAASKTLRK